MYKVVAKLLSNIIKPSLDSFISWSQTAFVPGRQILENIVIAKELLHSMNNSSAKDGYFALTVDMAKAYDRVNWKFLYDMLTLMGVHGHSLSLIMKCVTSVSFSINLNGGPHGLFRSERGMVIKKAHIDYNDCIRDNPRFSLEETITDVVSWQPPEYDYCKVNVDAAFTPNK
ncbi:uncharacterized protein LOC113346206 [Papaver somniferum]|uniref:uncharacterized protein LOC113346206 n=1 Tax=Papaver somniferum TaxID=3469 RepID=UPI000E6FAC69|nr:uncharacterized protein LOC113346206 [Papaver somniferum]